MKNLKIRIMLETKASMCALRVYSIKNIIENKWKDLYNTRK